MWFRVFYFLLWTLLLPLACLRLLWRGRSEAGYLRHWNERFGGGAALPAGRWYLVHAVSVGETRAAAPLVRAILAAHGQNRVLLTGTTPAGRETAAQLFGAEARVTYRWLPWDHPALVRRWLARVRPQAALVMETEWWPGLFAACAAQQVPVADTTGAGDAFFSGVAAGLTYGKTLPEACSIGIRLASSVICSLENTCPQFLPSEFGFSV